MRSVPPSDGATGWRGGAGAARAASIVDDHTTQQFPFPVADGDRQVAPGAAAIGKVAHLFASGGAGEPQVARGRGAVRTHDIGRVIGLAVAVAVEEQQPTVAPVGVCIAGGAIAGRAEDHRRAAGDGGHACLREVGDEVVVGSDGALALDEPVHRGGCDGGGDRQYAGTDNDFHEGDAGLPETCGSE